MSSLPVFLSVVIMVVINALEGDPFMNWLQKCFFGLGPKKKYGSAKEEMSDFEDAFKGVVVA
jgi:sensor histidine kinase regulating citrate/malate metabolism